MAVILALALTVLMGFVALGADMASLYRARAALQATSDLTAMSAVADPAAAAARTESALAGNGLGAANLREVQTGRYLRNPALPPEARFTPLPAGTPGINAVKVGLTRQAPLHFAVVLTDDDTVALNGTATASLTGATSFSLNSHVAGLNGTALGRALGTGTGFTAQQVLTLAETGLDAAALLTAIARQAGLDPRNPAEILTAEITTGQLLAALQDVLPPEVSGILAPLAGSDRTIRVDAVIGGIDPALGLTAMELISQAGVSALDVLRAIALAEAPASALSLDTALSVPGLLGLEAAVHAGEPAAHSGWITIGEVGVTEHRAALRLAADLTLDPALLGSLGVGVTATELTLPLYVELAGATATLTRHACQGDSPDDVVASFRTAQDRLHPANGTAVAAVYLGTLSAEMIEAGPVDPGALDYADILTLTLRIDLPILPDIVLGGLKVQARSQVSVGTSQTQEIHYTRADVAAGDRVRAFGTGQALSTTASGLLSPDSTDIRIDPAQSGLVSGTLAGVVNGVMAILPDRIAASLLSPVDGVLDALLSDLGVTPGAGELTLAGHHCERVQLVR